MGKVAAIASGKGGTGKSTVTAFLGRALSQQGKTTLLVEADLGLRSLDLMLGVEGSTVYDCADVLEGRCRVSQAASAAGPLGLWLLAGCNDPDYVPNPLQWRRFLDLCRRCYDFTLVDLSGGVNGFVRGTCAAADVTLVVATPDSLAVRDCAQLSRLLLKDGTDRQKLVINQVPAKLQGDVEDLDAVMDGVGIGLIGVIPQEEAVHTAVLQGVPLSGGKAKTVFDNMADRLCGVYRPLCIR